MLRYHEEWKLAPTDLDLSVNGKGVWDDIDWFHEYFVHTTKTIDYGIKSVDATETETGSTKIELERIGLMPMPLDVWVEYTDGSKEEFYIPVRIMRGEKATEHTEKRTIVADWPWVEPTYTLTLPVSLETIRSISIDPSQRMADINNTNNVRVLISEQY